jgi:hypothetical protein
LGGVTDRVNLREWRWVLALTVVSVGGLGLGLLPIGHGASEGVLITALAAACLLPVADSIRRRRFDLFEIGIAVAVVYLFLFPVRALLVVPQVDPTANSRILYAPFHTIRLTLVVATVGMLAAAAGYIVPFGARLGRRVRIPRARLTESPPLLLTCLIFVAGSVALAIGVAAKQSAFGGRSLTVPGLTGRASGLVGATSALVLVGLCLLTWRAVRSGARRDRALLLVAVAATVALGVGGKYKEVAIIAIFSPLVMWHFSGGRAIRARWPILALVAVVFVIFPFVQLTRKAQLRVDSSNPVTLVRALPAQAENYSWLNSRPRYWHPWMVLTDPLGLISKRLYGYESLGLAVRYTPSQIPFQDGATLKRLGEGLVPRILWPGKPHVGLGLWFSIYYWTYPGLPPVPQTVTHPGELWIDFGFYGVVIGLLLFGLWYRFVFNALRPRESPTAATLYTIVFVSIVNVSVDIPFLYVTMIQRVVATAALLVAVELGDVLWARWRGRSAASVTASPSPQGSSRTGA